MKRPSYFITALALYFTYFVHGIGVSILSQYKEALAANWQANSIAAVLQVIAALGLGRLVALPFSGPISDRYGRKVSGLIGVALYVLYFFGIALAPSWASAYVFALIGGIANSFLDTCVTPTVLEIFKDKGAIANMFTKFSMSIGQFILPFMIGMAASASLSHKAIFYIMGTAIAIDGVLIALLPFPSMVSVEASKQERALRITKDALAVILMGFTTTATFVLWLNCNQELGALYGLSDPTKIQSAYAVGTIIAILATAFVVLKRLKTEEVLFLYPAICLITLLLCYFIRTPLMAMLGGFFIGYAGAGGVLQLVVATANMIYPMHKGKMTALVMMASSVANYIVLALAGWVTAKTGVDAPLNVLLLNMCFTGMSVLLAGWILRKKRRA